jgi:hypothetical protein
MDEIRFWLFGNQLRKITADMAVEESSRVLVFRDHNVDRAPSYILEVKVVAARFFHDLSMKEDPSAEIILETDNANQTVSRTISIHIAVVELTHD